MSTILQLPTKLTDEQTLKRVLSRLIEEVDKLLGNRGDDPALRASELAAAQDTLATLTAELNSLTAEASSLRDDIERSILILKSALTITEADVQEIKGYWQSKTLDNTYYDFNDNAWNLLRGNYEFTTTGDTLVNAPFTPIVAVDPDPQIEYTIYVTTLPGQDGKAVLRMIVIEDGAALATYSRAGGLWFY